MFFFIAGEGKRKAMSFKGFLYGTKNKHLQNVIRKGSCWREISNRDEV